jgi:hypothetical protein
VAISLVHTVDVAADYADEPLREWNTLLGELRVAPALIVAADCYLAANRFDPWVIRAPLTSLSHGVFKLYQDRTRASALLLICYVNAHDKAIKELDHAFGGEGSHYTAECKEVLRQEHVNLIHAQHYLLDLSEADAVVSAQLSKKPTAASGPVVRRPLHRMATKDFTKGSMERMTVKNKNASSIASNYVVQSVYARQAAQCLIAEMERHVRELMRCGCMDESLSEELLEALHHDTVRMDKEEREEMDDAEHTARVLLQLKAINQKHVARTAARMTKAASPADARPVQPEGLSKA